MSILRSAFVMAVVGATCWLPSARAEDLAGTVAAKLRESGALAGYRVNVKAKSGTVWLEGRVADQKQLASAVSLAENTPGVERVVNRLSIGGQAAAGQGVAALGMPASAWSVAGKPQPATASPRSAGGDVAGQAVAQQTIAAGKPAARGLESPVQLAQALAAPQRTAPPQDRLAPASPAATAAAMNATTKPRPLPMSPAGPVVPAAAQAKPPVGRVADARGAMRGPVQRTSMRGDPMHLPSPGGYSGPVADGQMVPGSMRVVDGGPVNGGVEGGYAVDGQAAAAGGYGGGGPGYSGGPMPMGGTGVGMPPIPGRADGPNMPNYAWPSYAASPNVAAVQYPTQYSPTAWPYIGPFYPYPQVPLGWRRVSLEWDDGWWWLDFDERHIHSHHR
ncbi:MAG: hypothetical protein RLZZ111_613 [Planctomycetota bacterium]|jgi:hypothetical protein